MSFLKGTQISEFNQSASKIIVIATYFGEWPVWFPAFLLSCAKNETIDWLFFTDCEIPKTQYSNVKFIPMDLDQINHLASKKLGLNVQKAVFSQVDLQPAYGMIFEEYIKGFNFWGHCDIDVVWGNIRTFITEEILENHDIVSCRKDFLAGHLTLWRNEPRINTLFMSAPAYREIFSSSDHFCFDEAIISLFLRTLIEDNKQIRIYWSQQMIAWFRGKNRPIGWYWENGKMFDQEHHEFIYMHFHSAKKFVQHIDFQVGEQPAKFMFTQHGIQSRQPSTEVLKDKFNWNSIRAFGKYGNRLISSIRMLKRLLHTKNIYWSQKLMENSISGKEAYYDRKTGHLLLKRLDIHLEKHEHLLLKSFHWAVLLKENWNGNFYKNKQGEIFFEAEGLRVMIQTAEDIQVLKELFIDGTYNIQFLYPTVVIDVGMNVGLTSVFFASQSEVVVIGCEPCQKPFDQAARNFNLNQTLGKKIQMIRVGVGVSNYRTIASHLPKSINYPEPHVYIKGYGMSPKYEYEEIDIMAISDLIDSASSKHEGKEIAIKIDLEKHEYYIPGKITERAIISKLQETKKIDLISTIMLKWHKRTAADDPVAIVNQLQGAGFRVMLFGPKNKHNGMLYAIRTSRPISGQSLKLNPQNFEETNYA